MVSRAKWDKLQNQIVKFFQRNPSGQFTRKELMEYLNIGWYDYDPVHKILSYLWQQGFLYRTQQDHGFESSFSMLTYYYRIVHNRPSMQSGYTQALMVAQNHFRLVNTPVKVTKVNFSTNKNLLPKSKKPRCKRYVHKGGKIYLYHYDTSAESIQISLLHYEQGMPKFVTTETLIGLKDVYLCYEGSHYNRLVSLVIFNIKRKTSQTQLVESDVYNLVKNTITHYENTRLK